MVINVCHVVEDGLAQSTERRDRVGRESGPVDGETVVLKASPVQIRVGVTAIPFGPPVGMVARG